MLTVLRWAGLELDDWQESFLFDSLRQRSDGMWSAFECAGVVPRQNGKGAIMEARQLAGLFVLGERLQLHTAHEFKTCVEHFLRVKALVEGSDELFEQVKIVRTGAGDQSIELHTGQRLRFLARSRSSGRGFSADVVYFDEAFELPVNTVGAVLPSLSARPNPQVWYFSSAPHVSSDQLHSLLRRADDGEDDRLFLRAWENPPETDPGDVGAWRRVNPALGIRIDEDFVRNEMRALVSTPDGVGEFRRERLGIREADGGLLAVVPFEQWLGLVDQGAKPRLVVYGLAASPDGGAAAVSSAWVCERGRLHVDVVRAERGTDWVVPFLVELSGRKRSPIRVVSGGAETAFVRPLEDAGVDLDVVGSEEYKKGCGEFLDGVRNGSLFHLNQSALNEAVAAAGRRDIGHEGGWVWAHPGLTDISPLKAATVALSGVVSRRRKPRVHVLEVSV